MTLKKIVLLLGLFSGLESFGMHPRERGQDCSWLTKLCCSRRNKQLIQEFDTNPGDLHSMVITADRPQIQFPALNQKESFVLGLTTGITIGVIANEAVRLVLS